ncbi:MAG: hypothetical protein LUG96_12840 [Tannerellaceae bacterium]|nr:hypothetical protein [Tannerellaceae bacterium]
MGGDLTYNISVYPTSDHVEVTKTVYDPSPVGHKMPPYNVFSGFISNGDSYNSYATDPEDVNGYIDMDAYGYYFLTGFGSNLVFSRLTIISRMKLLHRCQSAVIGQQEAV